MIRGRRVVAAVWVVCAAAGVLGTACSGDDGGTASSTTRPTGTASTSAPTSTSTPELDLEHPFGVHAPAVDALDAQDMAFEVRRAGAAMPKVEYVRERGPDGFEEYAGIYALDGATVVVSQALADAPTTSAGREITLANGVEAKAADAGGVRSVAWSEPRGGRFLRVVVYARSGDVGDALLRTFAASIPAVPPA